MSNSLSEVMVGKGSVDFDSLFSREILTALIREEEKEGEGKPHFSRFISCLMSGNVPSALYIGKEQKYDSKLLDYISEEDFQKRLHFWHRDFYERKSRGLNS